jgi:hypothetical protein
VVSATPTTAGVIAAGGRIATATQSIPTSSWTALTLGTAEHLTGGVTSSSGGLVVPAAGWYTVTATMAWTANGTGFRIVETWLNNAADGAGIIASDRKAGSGSSSAAVTVSRVVWLAAGDLVKVRVWQSSGAALLTNITDNPVTLGVASHGLIGTP